ncbi:MAG: hypothetical protein SGJ02_08980 [bacterium]|nr:hypothetical protein [bacterium]
MVIKKNDDLNWLKIEGEFDSSLQNSLQAMVQNRIAKAEFAEQDVDYIKNLSRPVIANKLSVSKERLEKIRLLCQLWDIDLRPSKITSHRKFLGPIIVTAKKAIQPILKMLLKDTINQQRDFNAAVITLVTDLSNQIDQKNH